MPWRVVANGAMLERVLGRDPATQAEKTATAIHREGEIIKEELASPFVQRYDNNDPTARALVERVEDSGEVDDEGNAIYVAVGAPSSDGDSPAPETDAEALARVQAAEARVTEVEGERDSISAELEQSKTRVSDLEGQVSALETQLKEAEEAAAKLVAFDDLSKEALEAEAAKREIAVTGTGANGNVKKDDLVKALEGGSSSSS